MVKRTILPFDYGGDVLDEDDKREINKLDDLSEEDMNKLSALFGKAKKYIRK